MKKRRVGPAGWRVYLTKAQEFRRLIDDAEGREDWNGVGLASVHCVISAVDALTSRYLGETSSSEDHGDVVGLLRQVPVDGTTERGNQVREVLDRKTLVEYLASPFGSKDAKATALRARRILEWVERILVPPG